MLNEVSPKEEVKSAWRGEVEATASLSPAGASSAGVQSSSSSVHSPASLIPTTTPIPSASPIHPSSSFVLPFTVVEANTEIPTPSISALHYNSPSDTASDDTDTNTDANADADDAEEEEEEATTSLVATTSPVTTRRTK